MAVNIIQGGLGYGALVGGTSAALGWVQNKTGINQWIQHFDSSYTLPLFKEALALGAPALVVELGARTVEEIDGHSTKLSSSYPFAFKMTMIALRTFAFVKLAEAFSNCYMPMDQKFIYQAAALYAIGVNDPGNVTVLPIMAGAIGSMVGILIGSGAWFGRNVFGDRLYQWFDPTYISPSFKDAFTFGAVGITISLCATTILKSLDKQSIEMEQKQPKIWTIIETTVVLLSLWGVAEVMKQNNYQIHQIFTNQMMIGTCSNMLKALFSSNNNDEQSPE
ncbi:MAG: hypothetical protein KFB93_07820 [Simkaniaceae bacterium]|nr:MAG: hypothetical protein KFB93_07820 [Simkaniaceae bacterium]